MSEQSTIQWDDLNGSEKEAIDLIQAFCENAGLNLSPVVHNINPPYLDVELVGDDAESTFGRSGKGLDALQYLLNLIVSKQSNGSVRVTLDAAGYRARRVVILEALARECVENVLERQEECELDPLPAHERRIVHNILSEYPEIRTYSEGEDPDRRVIIAPRA